MLLVWLESLVVLINDRVKFLKDFSIPEPVTGGLLFTILFNLMFMLTGMATSFDLVARDFLLLYFLHLPALSDA